RVAPGLARAGRRDGRPPGGGAGGAIGLRRHPRAGRLPARLHRPLPRAGLRGGRRGRPGDAPVIVGFDATTLVGRISGVGYYTKRLLETLADGAGGPDTELVVLSNRPVPVTPRPHVRVHEGGRFPVR